MNDRTEPAQDLSAFWSMPMEDLLPYLRVTPQGLTAEEARQRLISAVPRLSAAGRGRHALSLLLAQFQSPIILILLVAAALSLFLRETTDALIILAIVLVSGLLGFRAGMRGGRCRGEAARPRPDQGDRLA